MASLFNPDFQDFLEALHKREVRYVLVGGYSVILHGYKRTTGDMDIWVERSSENYERLVKALDTNIDGVTVRLIHYNHLIRAKEAAGRPRDLNDIEQLKKGRI